MPALILSAWHWVLATPTRAWVAVLLLGFLTNVAIRFFTSKEWAGWCEKHPRLVGLFLMLKGALPEGGTVLRGLWAAVTGELRERAKKFDPTKLVDSPERPGGSSST